MKLKRVTVAWMLILVLLFQIVLPITSIATEETKTIVFNDQNLYTAIKETLGESIINYDDIAKTIVISNSSLAEITKLELKNKDIKDISGLENFTELEYLELSGNELTADSNLEVLLKLEKATTIDLSTNKIDSLEKIKSLYEAGKLIVTGQIINYVELVKVDTEAQQTAAIISKPDILTYVYDNEDKYSKISVQSDNDNLANNKFKLDTTRITVGKIDKQYELYSGKLNVSTTIESGDFKGSIIKLAYVVFDDNCEGIVFKDENLYKAIKAQLTAGQKENSDLASYDAPSTEEDESRTLYEAAYDDELILIIEKDILNNDITSFILDNHQIEDLTGIEYFRALTVLSLNKNYIEDVSKILELQNGKIKLREEIIAKLEGLKSELSELNSNLEKTKKEQEQNKKDIESKQKEVTTIIQKYIKTQIPEEEQKAIADGAIYSDILEKVKVININDTDDEGKVKDIKNISYNNYTTSGIYNSTYSTELETKLSELKTVLNKDAEYPKIISDNEEKIKAKIEKFEKTYSRWMQLISIISDETMKMSLTKYYNDMTGEEIKTNFAKLKEVILEEHSTIESKVEELTSDELRIFTNGILSEDTVTKEEAKKQFEDWDKIINELPEEYDSITNIAKRLNNLKTRQNYIYKLELKNFSDEDIQKIAKRLANADTSKVTIDNLENLYLNHNNISSLDVISSIPNLKELDLSYNLITDLQLMKDSELQKTIITLNLGYNMYIDDASYLQKFSKLQELSLAGNNISDISQLDYSKFTKLTDLNLSDNKISDLKNVLKQLKKLKNFYVEDNEEKTNQKIAGGFVINNQYITMNVEIPQTSAKTATIALPNIFTQAEKFQPGIVYFENATLQQGTATVTVPTTQTGTNKKVVSIKGNDSIANGTTCEINYTVTKNVESVNLDKTSLELKVGETAQLTATVTPDNATNKNINWSSSNNEVATVENGTVRALAEGKTTITVTTEDGNKVATCEVRVEKIKLDKIEVKTNPNKVEYKIGENLDTTGLVLLATYTDENTKEITTGFECNPTTLNTEGTQEIKVSYTEDEITKETAFSVNVIKEQEAEIEEKEELKVVVGYTTSTGNGINYIEKVNSKTGIQEFKDRIIPNKTDAQIKVISKDQEVTEGYIGTGMTVEISSGDEKITYNVIVTGDCTGDGIADFNDILVINKYRLNKVQIEGEYLKAADVTNDGNADFSDILQINKYRLGKIEIL